MGMSQRIAKGALLRMDAAELIDFVTRTTLAEISSWSAQDLVDIGWMEALSSEVSLFGLYSLTSAGVWIARKNTSGQLTDAYSLSINAAVDVVKKWAPRLGRPQIAAGTPPDTTVNIVRSAILHFATDGAGVAAAQALHTGPALYYPVVRLKRLISDVADPATTLQRTVTGGALVGGANRVVAIVAGVSLDLGDELLYNLTDASVISLAIDAGPVSAHIYLEYEYWSET